MVTSPLTTRGTALFVAAGAVGGGLVAAVHALDLSPVDTTALSILLVVDALFVGAGIALRYRRTPYRT
jgi:hypothetical protein